MCFQNAVGRNSIVRGCFSSNSVFEALLTITLSFIFHILFDALFLIYHSQCVHFTILNKDLRWMLHHHRPIDDNNPFIENVFLQSPVSSWLITELLQLSNLFQTPCNERRLRLEYKHDALCYWFCLASSSLLHNDMDVKD